jgi:hypothetical protein
MPGAESAVYNHNFTCFKTIHYLNFTGAPTADCHLTTPGNRRIAGSVHYQHMIYLP